MVTCVVRQRIRQNRRRIRLGLALLSSLLLVWLPNMAAAQPGTPEVTVSVGGTSTMLACAPEQCRYPHRFDVFQVRPGDPLRAEFSFIQWYPDPKPFRIFLLLNYRQADFAARQVFSRAEERRVALASPIALPQPGVLAHVLEFTVAPEAQVDFDLSTEPLAPGYYDLALVIVPEPDQNQRELPYWTVRQMISRASVYVGDAATPPTFAYPLVDPTPAPDSGFSELLWFGREPHNTRLKGEQRVAPGEEVTLLLNYQPYAGNLADAAPPDTPVPVAFVAFIDDWVVPLNDQPVLYASALPNRLSSFPVTVRVPDAPGIHQIFIQQFPNPYVDPKVAEETGRELFGISSQRFILDAG